MLFLYVMLTFWMLFLHFLIDLFLVVEIYILYLLAMVSSLRVLICNSSSAGQLEKSWRDQLYIFVRNSQSSVFHGENVCDFL
jgi:hypothetical protein